MKLKLYLFLCFFCARFLHAQFDSSNFYIGKIVSDSTSLDSTPACLNLENIQKSRHKIEVRIISDIGILSNSSQAVVLYFDTLHFEGKIIRNSYPNSKYEFKNLAPDKQLDSIFNVLSLNNIFSLPIDTFHKILIFFDKEKNNLMGIGRGVADGTTYTIQFKINEYTRQYHFSNPDSFETFYDLYPQLKNMANIASTYHWMLEIGAK